MKLIFLLASVLIVNRFCLCLRRCADLRTTVHLPQRPVCGTDGRTYFHEQEIENHNCLTDSEIKVNYLGFCKKFCGYIRPLKSPLCGTNGVTYQNQDALNYHNCLNAYINKSGANLAHVAYRGPCQPMCGPVDPNPAPVCGSDGRMHNNIDSIRAHNCAHFLQGEYRVTMEPNPLKCFDTCPLQHMIQHTRRDEDYGPVCGSDGKSYSGEREIHEYNCKEKLKGSDRVRVIYIGYCVTDCPNAPQYWDPVCGNDGKTYENKYVLQEINCIDLGKISEFYPAKVAYSGICGEPCPKISSKRKPVCGTDGVTYENKSILKHHNCMNKIFGHEKITVAHKGECR